MNQAFPIPLESIVIGMEATHKKIIRSQDVSGFADISDDFNPIHFEDEYARAMGFSKRIVHGMISSSIFSGIYATKMPGPGSLIISQSFKYKKPVYIGDEVTATVRASSLNISRRVVKFLTTCETGGELVITGEAQIYVPSAEKTKGT
jgi:3-hydroxybutyryl-CoA dehydratase